MRIQEDFILKEVAGSYVVVPVGEKLVDFSAMITLNETGAFLWEKLKEEKSVDQLVDDLLKEYHVDPSVAKSDVEEFVQLLRNEKLLIE
ncbi:MAG: PqqD family protein [Tissierellia bacterium]|nr:PqqD family protein [Tissierellia bacterium]